MDITLNGETRSVPDGLTAAGLLEHLEMTGQRLAMEVNGEIVPRGLHAGHRIQPGDRVEIVRAIGGG
ncbi:thiamine biosynthesis protein ThiS [Thioalkalivibrio sulfidiphilus HL-EbGr7]|uniref:Thiamine biosynthesis protein ThiS n=1 Tax=Thioalkalivibrio sulfidiphilus (strain HL-EbGR7) TaxID=396588 RepID=B8GQS9_THISH|nr:sulfur carrier protein ThiS [Thioalkalivibrio sulfidiphilus]ACL74303.1 thiamine biosynthesis protein ThiS [Thioalkalivibrio sulfidiphilus HL-EbGr7]